MAHLGERKKEYSLSVCWLTTDHWTRVGTKGTWEGRSPHQKFVKIWFVTIVLNLQTEQEKKKDIFIIYLYLR